MKIDYGKSEVKETIIENGLRKDRVKKTIIEIDCGKAEVKKTTTTDCFFSQASTPLLLDNKYWYHSALISNTW